MSKPAVFALVDNETQARAAVSQLEASGFLAQDISIISQSARTGGLVSDPDGVLPASGTSRDVGHDNSTKRPKARPLGASRVALWVRQPAG